MNFKWLEQFGSLILVPLSFQSVLYRLKGILLISDLNLNPLNRLILPFFKFVLTDLQAVPICFLISYLADTNRYLNSLSTGLWSLSKWITVFDLHSFFQGLFSLFSLPYAMQLL